MSVNNTEKQVLPTPTKKTFLEEFANENYLNIC
jgi:hypothetical protein